MLVLHHSSSFLATSRSLLSLLLHHIHHTFDNENFNNMMLHKYTALTNFQLISPHVDGCELCVSDLSQAAYYIEVLSYFIFQDVVLKRLLQVNSTLEFHNKSPANNLTADDTVALAAGPINGFKVHLCARGPECALRCAAHTFTYTRSNMLNICTCCLL